MTDERTSVPCARCATPIDVQIATKATIERHQIRVLCASCLVLEHEEKRKQAKP